MTVEGYFDGTAVRTLEPVDLKPNQKVFIQIPKDVTIINADEERKKRQKAAIEALSNLLTKEESDELEKSLSQHLKFKTVDL